MINYACDFETNISAPTKVWLWCICKVNNNKTVYKGYSIDTFIDFVKYNKGKYWFHNLKFDGTFILDYLLRQNIEFDSLISDMGVWYSINLFDSSIYDSYKVLLTSIKELGKLHGVIEKGEIEFTDKEDGYIPTKEEIEYCEKDVRILAIALKEFFSQGYNKITLASNAMKVFKKLCKTNIYKLNKEEDNYLRKSYVGGYVKTGNKQLVESGRIYDTVSMYPSVMYDSEFPISKPIFTREIVDKGILHFIATFSLKNGSFPITSIKAKHQTHNSALEYVKEGAQIEFYMTHIDFEEFNKNYDIFEYEYIDGCYFEEWNKDLFKPYIDKFIKEKNDNEGLKRYIAKIFLNALYGKFGAKLSGQRKIPFLNEKNVLSFRLGEPEDMQGYNVAIASYITAYSRKKLFHAIRENIDRFLYSDTDSIHLEGDMPIKGVEVGKALGNWNHEITYDRGKYLGTKKYIYEKDGNLHIKCAGLKKSLHEQVTFENFEKGMVYKNSFNVVKVKGGSIFKYGDYKI